MKLEVLNEIAKKHLGVETLETRNNDEEDFYDISVWSLKSALVEAYNKGVEKNSNKNVSDFIELLDELKESVALKSSEKSHVDLLIGALTDRLQIDYKKED